MDVRAVPGVCGLRNLGCTCFMNSALQCLSNAALLSEYFVSGRFRADVRAHNPMGTQGKLTEDFAALLRAMWSGGYNSVSPAPFKDTLGKWVPQFKGYDQQDSQELLATLLDKIHEDLNAGKPLPEGNGEEAAKDKRVAKKKGEGIRGNDGEEEKDDVKIGEKDWKAYTDRNKSKIVDLFYGQLRSSLTCPVCGTVSTTFDPFLTLSVPLVDERYTQVQCVYVSYEESGADKLNQSAALYDVSLPRKDPKVGDLRAEMADLVGVENAADLMIGLMQNINIRVISKYAKDNEKLSSMRGTKFCYRVPGINEDNESIEGIENTEGDESIETEKTSENDKKDENIVSDEKKDNNENIVSDEKKSINENIETEKTSENDRKDENIKGDENTNETDKGKEGVESDEKKDNNESIESNE